MYIGEMFFFRICVISILYFKTILGFFALFYSTCIRDIAHISLSIFL